MAPDEHRLKLFTSKKLGERRNLLALLDGLEAHGLTPTHAGSDRRTKEPYDRDAVTLTGERPLLVLVRRKQPTLTVTTRAQKRGLTTIAVETGKLAAPAVLYQLGDVLAEAFEVVHGVVHPSYGDEGDFNMAGSIELGWLRDIGPMKPAARSWYGTHMVALFGDALKRAGGEQRPMPWGAVRVDLVAEPWKASFRVLAKRQAAAEQALATSGALGDYRHAIKYLRGPRWVPIPEH